MKRGKSKDNNVSSFADRIINQPTQTKVPKYRMTIEIDHELWELSRPLLAGKYGQLMEDAIESILKKAGKKSS